MSYPIRNDDDDDAHSSCATTGVSFGDKLGQWELRLEICRPIAPVIMHRQDNATPQSNHKLTSALTVPVATKAWIAQLSGLINKHVTGGSQRRSEHGISERNLHRQHRYHHHHYNLQPPPSSRPSPSPATKNHVMAIIFYGIKKATKHDRL